MGIRPYCSYQPQDPYPLRSRADVHYPHRLFSGQPQRPGSLRKRAGPAVPLLRSPARLDGGRASVVRDSSLLAIAKGEGPVCRDLPFAPIVIIVNAPVEKNHSCVLAIPLLLKVFKSH